MIRKTGKTGVEVKRTGNRWGVFVVNLVTGRSEKLEGGFMTATEADQSADEWFAMVVHDELREEQRV